MDYETFAFEKVSIAEAIAAKKSEDLPPKEEPNWEARRQPLLPVEQKLQDETCLWMIKLPKGIRPLLLSRQFPRIANKIAATWYRPVLCDQIFEELMIDHRGTRQGFPVEIAMEISELRGYFNTVVNQVRQDDWTLTL